MNELPYYKQQTPYTCALACMRMVLEHVGRKISEYELSKIIGFDLKRGYSMPMFKDILDIMGIEYKLIPKASIEELGAMLKYYPIVIISPKIYQNIPEEHGHTVVVKDIAEKSVIINDPDQQFGGESKEIDLSLFIRAWGESRNWMLVIKGEEK